MQIKALIFDIGGVLYRTVDTKPLRKWERHLGVDKGQLAEIVFTNPAAQLATIGKAAPDDVWREVGRRFSLSPERLSALRADFWKGGEWDMELLNFIRSVKSRYKTGIISDGWSDSRENVKQYVNYDLFDVIVFSAEEGIKKPDPGIFTRALARSGVEPQEAVFVDDRVPNVAGAEQIGMKGIHHVETPRTLEVIQQLLQTQS
jgi:HAD superfamily hydrolase (TIGR01549 family)